MFFMTSADDPLSTLIMHGKLPMHKGLHSQHVTLVKARKAGAKPTVLARGVCLYDAGVVPKSPE